jgi:hypothetical protein
MKKGLNVTLLAVAIAMMAAQAMASAPVIGTIPDVIVGATTSASQPTAFVFVDAFDLNSSSVVTDDTTAAANILWSYTYTGTATYRINNVDPIVVGTDSINAPGAKRLNGTTVDPKDASATGGDGASHTVTIRNILYAPISGSAQTPGTGITAGQSVRLFASDGSAYDQHDITIYTDFGGPDRLGSPVSHGSVPTTSFGNALDGNYHTGTVTVTTDGGTDVCLETPIGVAGAVHWGEVMSQYGSISLSPNTVYRIRARVNGNQSGPGTVPFWDMVIRNWDGTHGLNLYGADMMVFDHLGGANSTYNKPSTNGTTIEFDWAPNAMLNAAWNNTTTGVFATTAAANKNCNIAFRVLNYAAITGTGQGGKICLNQMLVDAIPWSSLSPQAITGGSSSSLTASNAVAADAFGTNVSVSVTWSGGTLTVAPTTSGQNSAFVTITPGGAIDYGNLSTLVTGFPITWTSNQTYMITWNLKAPNQTGEDHPFDAMWIGMDAPTNELILVSFTSGAQNRCGMPKQGTAQPFIAFFNGNTETAASNPSQYHRLRPKLMFGNDPSLVWNTNTGSVEVDGWSVQTVAMP